MRNLVSVIITTYKRPIKTLERAVKSVIKQTYKQIEIIVVNDAPEDIDNANDIRAMLSIYSEMIIKYIEPEKNSGACAARNLGLENAKGEFISFLDDDDYWFENKIEVQLGGMKEKNIGVVYTPYYVKQKDEQELVKTVARDGKLTEALLYRNTMCIFPLMRTELVRSIDGFDKKLPSSQEHDLLLRLSEICEFKFIDIPVAVYDVSEESISMNIPKKIKGFEVFMCKHEKLYLQYPDAYYYQLIRMVNNMNNAGEFSYAFKLWKKAVKIKKNTIQNIVQPIKGLVKYIVGRRAFH